MDNLDDKMFEEFETKSYLVNLEKDLVNVTIDELPLEVEAKKNELESKILDFQDTYMDYDDKGKLKLRLQGSPALVISEYFFKPIVPTFGVEPKYSAEKMAVVFDIYRMIVSRINEEIGKFIPNKTHFCRFACITSVTYNNYLKCSDENLQNVMLMIDDYMLDSNLTSSQNREVDNVTTIYRTKVEQNKVEQPAPQTVVITENVDISMIQKRISRLTNIKDAKVVGSSEE